MYLGSPGSQGHSRPRYKFSFTIILSRPLVVGSVLALNLGRRDHNTAEVSCNPRLVDQNYGTALARFPPGERNQSMSSLRRGDRKSVMENGLGVCPGNRTDYRAQDDHSSAHPRGCLLAYAPNLSPSLHKLTEMTPSSLRLWLRIGDLRTSDACDGRYLYTRGVIIAIGAGLLLAFLVHEGPRSNRPTSPLLSYSYHVEEK